MGESYSQLRFEELLAKLEAIVKSLENDDLGLEKTIEVYEEGLKLTSECNRRLNQAEKKVEILRRTSDGEVVGDPFDPETGGEG